MANRFNQEQHDALSKQKSFTKKDFDNLYRAYHKRVYEFVLKRVSLKEVAEDLTSEIFEKIYKSVEDFKWQGISISAWIFRIARNRIIDYYRKNAKRKNDSSLYDYTNVIESPLKESEELMIESEEHVALYNSIREFSEQDQYLIYYKFFETFNNKKIAKLMQMSETNVGTRLHRIRKKMAKLIEKKKKKK